MHFALRGCPPPPSPSFFCVLSPCHHMPSAIGGGASPSPSAICLCAGARCKHYATRLAPRRSRCKRAGLACLVSCVGRWTSAAVAPLTPTTPASNQDQERPRSGLRVVQGAAAGRGGVRVSRGNAFVASPAEKPTGRRSLLTSAYLSRNCASSTWYLGGIPR
jgi:hypothetical protein